MTSQLDALPRPRLVGGAERVTCKRRRASRRRPEIPADPATIERAQQLTHRRHLLERRLAAIVDERLQVVADLRRAGCSAAEIAELLAVSKGRAQQLTLEAIAAGYLTPAEAGREEDPPTA